ncbi:MAG: hypothetical protein U0736_26870 [Gemmataceae bacterium]
MTLRDLLMLVIGIAALGVTISLGLAIYAVVRSALGLRKTP